MSERILYLDIIRIVACIMIIAMHAPIPNTVLDSYILSANSLITASGVGLFIMVSGALLLPVNIPTRKFLNKRLGKILCPTIIWTIFYYLMAPYTYTVSQGVGLLNFISIPFSSQFNGVLWFMYMLAGLYLLSPILSPWLRKVNHREVEFYLCLWGITLCYPIIRNFVLINEGSTGMLYYFGGYIGYFLLGYYLNNFNKLSRVWICVLLLVIPIGIAVLLKLLGTKIDFYDLFGYLSIFIVMMSIAIFNLIKKIKSNNNESSKFKHILILVSNFCFGKPHLIVAPTTISI